MPTGKLVNLTKRTLRLHDTSGRPLELPPDPRHIGIVAVGEHHGVEVEAGRTLSINVRHVHEIKGMPDPEPGSWYIVPAEVAMALQGRREDVLFPADDEHVAGEDGRQRPVTHLRRVVSRMA